MTADGTIYIADTQNERVEKVTPGRDLSVVAGSGSYGTPTPGLATSSKLASPEGVALDSAGDLYIADTDNGDLEKVDTTGALTIVASGLASPDSVAVGTGDRVYVADTGANTIDLVHPDGTLTVVAGTGTAETPSPGPATSSALNSPTDVVTDTSGDLFVADRLNNVIEEVNPTGDLRILAGTGTAGPPTAGAAPSSDLDRPGGGAVDGAGNLLIADTSNQRAEEVGASAATPTPALPEAPTAVVSAVIGLLASTVVLRRYRRPHMPDVRDVRLDVEVWAK